MPTKNEFLELPKNVWTIAKKWKPGDETTACEYRIQILGIVEERDTYNLAKVQVLGPAVKETTRWDPYEKKYVQVKLPPLTFHGEEYGPVDW